MSEQLPPQSSKNERIATLITPEPTVARPRRAFLDSAPAARRRSPLIGALLGLAIAIIAAALYWLLRG